MKLQTVGDRRNTAVRAVAKAQSKERYPEGKALARIQYFEAQRGLSLTRVEESRVQTGPTQPTLPGRPRKPSAKRPPVPYAAAQRAKTRLSPAFPATVNLPVWR